MDHPRKIANGEPLPVRKHPSTNSVHENGFRPIILFVTVCTEGRASILANPVMAERIVAAWGVADKWAVGRYVIMPDHVHFFCAPTTHPPYDLQKWVTYWKRMLAQTMGHDVKLWQNGCWDTQMRTGEQYETKWEYMRYNPVRKGLADKADEWPYQGVVHDLQWVD